MLAPFKELLEFDISKYVSKKPIFKYDKIQNKFVESGAYLDYISWVDCLILLYENGAEHVEYGNMRNAEGHSLFTYGGGLPEVRVFVEIDGKRYEATYPLIDGSKDIGMDKATQSDVHNASQRAFVKCVAINTGLGLKLWQKEEQQQKEPREMDKSAHSIIVCIERVKELLANVIQEYPDERQFYSDLNLTKKQVEVIFNQSKGLQVLEDRLRRFNV